MKGLVMFTEEEKRITILALESVMVEAELKKIAYDEEGGEYDKSILDNAIKFTKSSIDKVRAM